MVRSRYLSAVVILGVGVGTIAFCSARIALANCVKESCFVTDCEWYSNVNNGCVQFQTANATCVYSVGGPGGGPTPDGNIGTRERAATCTTTGCMTPAGPATGARCASTENWGALEQAFVCSGEAIGCG